MSSNVQGSWNVGRTSGICAACGTPLTANMECWAALCDRPAAVVQTAPVPGAAPEKEKDAKEPASPFVRIDFCEKCWAEGKRPETLVSADGVPAGLTMFSFWKTVVATPQQKKKLLVDDSVLVDVFGRMEGKTEPQEVRFRFVLALILMRKRLLKYEGMVEKDEHGPTDSGAPEVWRMIPRGQEVPVLVVNPHLTGEQITEVSQQLSAILAEEV